MTMGNIAFVCDNFGPIHLDQCSTLDAALPPGRRAIGLELFADSDVYGWGQNATNRFTKVTLASGDERGRIGTLAMARRIVAACVRYDVKVVLFAHYERPYILLAAWTLRLLGRRTLIMSDSKFDDYTRYLWREVGKRMMMSPYTGGIAASLRCADYLRFLGIDHRNIRLDAYAIVPERVRGAADVPPAPDGVPFAERNFVCVARLVTKKNHLVLLDAYARYRKGTATPRRLVLCGSGPMEAEIRAHMDRLGIADMVDIRGNLSAAEVAHELGRGLCLMLPSISEQFGIVVIEAQVMGLPTILSLNCGARDTQIDSGVEGFLIENDNPEGMAFFMDQLASDEALWRRMSEAALRRGNQAHSARFAKAAIDLGGFA
jgi:glycosyltransferase involved in cell wall biosynthesis